MMRKKWANVKAVEKLVTKDALEVDMTAHSDEIS